LESLKRISQSFSGNLNTRKPSYQQHQGTGWSLHLQKHHREHGRGRMWVKSTKGKGSKFYFSLPAKKAMEQKRTPRQMINTIPWTGTAERRWSLRYGNQRRSGCQALNDVNIACDTAARRRISNELCRNKPSDYYNVILMDIHMPNMDGYTAAGILKKDLKVRPPIVALTASDINDQIRIEHADTIEAFNPQPFKARLSTRRSPGISPQGRSDAFRLRR
jgi:CheY-like chemotaxis protein